MINRLLDHLEETKRLVAETRAGLSQVKEEDLVEVLHQCEQLTQNQIRMLNRALRKL